MNKNDELDEFFKDSNEQTSDGNDNGDYDAETGAESAVSYGSEELAHADEPGYNNGELDEDGAESAVTDGYTAQTDGYLGNESEENLCAESDSITGESESCDADAVADETAVAEEAIDGAATGRSAESGSGAENYGEAIPAEIINPKKQKEKPKPTGKKKLNRAAKIVIAVAVILVVVAVSILTTVLVVNRDKIFVSDGADFANVDKGNYYVLKNDVTVNGNLTIDRPYSIDLNGYSLVVKGNLIYNCDLGAGGVLEIGEKDGKKYVTGGSVEADNITINSASGTVIIYSPMQAANITFNASKTQLKSSLRADSVLTVTSGTLNAEHQLEFGSDGAVVLNGATLNASKRVDAKIDAANNSKVIIGADAGAKSVDLDSTSTMQCSGKIDEYVEGGNLVIMSAGSSAPRLKGMNTLYRHKTTEFKEISNVAVCELIIDLTMPADMKVSSEGGRLYVYVTKVIHAARYKFVVDGKEEFTRIVEPVEGENLVKLDITDMVHETGKHYIAVTAMGAEGEELIVLDSETARYEYETVMTLKEPDGLLIESRKNKFFLSWNSVDFASGYIIEINGTQFTVENKEGDRQETELTSYMTEVGNYSVRIKAVSPNPNIAESDSALTSYTLTRKLNAPVITMDTTIENQVTISWEKTENALWYQITEYNAVGEIIGTKIVTQNSFTLSGDEIVSGYSYTVSAIGYDYYEDGDASNVITIA